VDRWIADRLKEKAHHVFKMDPADPLISGTDPTAQTETGKAGESPEGTVAAAEDKSDSQNGPAHLRTDRPTESLLPRDTNIGGVFVRDVGGLFAQTIPGIAVDRKTGSLNPDSGGAVDETKGISENFGRLHSRLENLLPVAGGLATIDRLAGKIDEGMGSLEVPHPALLDRFAVPANRFSGTAIGFRSSC
jgi:hypothetical protein